MASAIPSPEFLAPLAPEALRTSCDASEFSFATTAELADLLEIVGQDRAVDAIQFAMGMRREGYNVFVLGPPGTGKHIVVRKLLRERSAGEDVPSDWCYVYNFDKPHRPRALKLPTGTGVALREAVNKLIDDLRSAIPAIFESEDYRRLRQDIEDELKQSQEQVLSKIQAEAKERQIAIMQTESGIAFAPLREGKIIPPDEFNALPEADRELFQEQSRDLHERFRKAMEVVPKWARRARQRLQTLDREMTQVAVRAMLEDLHEQFSVLPQVIDYLNAFEADVIRHVALFRRPDAETSGERSTALSQAPGDLPAFRRYRVNILVDRDHLDGAPVIYADHPTYQELYGSIEHVAEMGTLVTDFGMIKAGALHRANGGYLVLDARKVLMEPHAWEGLKRALRTQEIRIESPVHSAGVMSTQALSPQPIPLSVKVVLIGEPQLYYTLDQHDPDFGELFKVTADFDARIERSRDNNMKYARLVGTLARREGLLPLASGAVARLCDHSARLAGDAEKLSTQLRRISDLVREADYIASQDGRGTIEADDVQRAIDGAIHRLSRVRNELQEQILHGTVLVDTAGEAVGQINGLSVLQLGRLAFGRPSRITARLRLGAGKVIDIEREVELGGPLHTKGVLILSGYLGARYAADRPLALSASLVFEQSYGGIDGDSASSAELYALLSALAEVPIKQSLAVTGSVNQNGQVQAIGGANEKIEGFFDVCNARGLTGEQGVLIPRSNVRNLMLRHDVVEAVAAGRFRIYAISTIDEGVATLTGMAAGERGADGAFPEDTINGRVERRMIELTELRRAYMAQAGVSDGGDGNAKR